MAIDRRSFVSFGSAAIGTGAGISTGILPSRAEAQTPAVFAGALDASHFGVRPGAPTDQGPELQIAIDEAARRGMPLFLQPGRYLVSNLTLPGGTYLVGVPGRTQLLFAGGNHLIYARGAEHVMLTGLTIAAAGNMFTSDTAALVHLRNCERLTIDGCTITGGDRSGLVLEYVSGHVTNCEIADVGEAALLPLDATGLEVSANHVHDCRNSGLEIWRSQPGDDGTIVTNNRIERILATKGGSGQNGNGISIFRAGGVIVSNNRIADCAFSAVRSNAGSNCQIVSNSCTRLGEVALYAEFGFEGAVISNNVVDQAAMGISITNFNEGGRLAVCSGNLIRNLFYRGDANDSESRGVGIGVEADTVVANNVIERAPRAGLSLGWGHALRDVSATGNVVRDAGIGIAVSVAPGAGNAVIADNLISGAKKGAIVGMQWLDAVTGDLAQAGTEKFPRLRVERNFAS